MKRCYGQMHQYVVIAGLVLLMGCGAAKTLVMAPPATKIQVAAVEVAEGSSTVNVPDDIKKAFHDKLTQLLYEEEGGFRRGTELKVRYRFIQYNPGSQFTRWFWGGIGNAGEGSMTVEAKYFDSTDQELASIQAEGKIGSGAFGGSFNFAVEKTAEEIAVYTKQSFH